MNSELRSEIEGLRKLKTKELQVRYRELFGEASPSSNHMHLFRRVAWRFQARAQGGLCAAFAELLKAKMEGTPAAPY